MKLTVTCQICGKVLSIVQKDVIDNDDISMYELSSSCDTLQIDGVTLDGQTDVQATKTVS
jgi:hypothetical protein